MPVEIWKLPKLTIDGRETEVVPANGVYRAVAVPVGAREVVFRYVPRSLRRGLLASGVSALVLVVIAWHGSRRGRRLTAPARAAAGPPSAPASA